MTPIEQFANRQGVGLNVLQMEAIRRWSVGATMVYPTQYKNQILKAKRIFYDYLQHGAGMNGETVEQSIYKEMEDFYG